MHIGIPEPNTLDFETWEHGAPEQLRADPIWRTKAYRLSVYLTELLNADTDAIRTHVGAPTILPQLHDAAGSIGANIADGYGRTSGRDRARFFQYALSSARESRHWYCTIRTSLPASTFHDRLELLDEIIRLLVTMVLRQRSG